MNHVYHSLKTFALPLSMLLLGVFVFLQQEFLSLLSTIHSMTEILRFFHYETLTPLERGHLLATATLYGLTIQVLVNMQAIVQQLIKNKGHIHDAQRYFNISWMFMIIIASIASNATSDAITLVQQMQTHSRINLVEWTQSNHYKFYFTAACLGVQLFLLFQFRVAPTQQHNARVKHQLCQYALTLAAISTLTVPFAIKATLFGYVLLLAICFKFATIHENKNNLLINGLTASWSNMYLGALAAFHFFAMLFCFSLYSKFVIKVTNATSEQLPDTTELLVTQTQPALQLIIDKSWFEVYHVDQYALIHVPVIAPTLVAICAGVIISAGIITWLTEIIND